jgi:hypothetical protein
VQLPWPRRRGLPGGITIEEIAVALGAVTTARVSSRLTLRIKGRDVPALGDGVIDFTRNMESHRLSVNGSQIEHLNVGADHFHLLSPGRQQATGKTWLWEKGCPHGNYWAQVSAAARHAASCTGSSEDVLAGEQVRCYSLLIKPRRKLLGKQDPSLRKLREHLHAHGNDRLNLDVWLAGDQTVRKMREHQAGLEMALLDGRTNIVTSTLEFSDLGLAVSLTAPPPEEVLGAPDQ